MTASFKCVEGDTSQVLCVVDESGEHWWLDGDYELQSQITKNDHSVWVKDGYLFVLDVDFYLFLHDADGQDEWYWAITEDARMRDDDLIVAKCNTTNIVDPSECETWFTTNYYIDRSLTFTRNEQITIDADFCPLTDNEICVQSNQSTLGTSAITTLCTALLS